MSENLKPTCVLVENAGDLLCRHCGKAWTPHDEVYFGYTKDGAPNRVCEAKEAPVDLSKVGLVDVDEFNKMLADYKQVKAEKQELVEVLERITRLYQISRETIMGNGGDAMSGTPSLDKALALIAKHKG